MSNVINVREEFNTKEEAEQHKESYYAAYHPLGYGTSLVVKEENGKWVVEGYRFNSCD